MSDKCKELIYGDWGRTRQCRNKAKSDGYCGIHHPDAVKRRQEKSEKAADERYKKSTYGRLEAAKAKIQSLQQENERRRS